MHFTDTKHLDALDQVVTRLNQMTGEVARYGRISVESQATLTEVPNEFLTQDERLGFGMESVFDRVKAGLQSLVRAVARVWRKMIEWMSDIFSRRHKKAEETEKMYDDIEETIKAANEHFKKQTDEHFKKHREAADLQRRYIEILKKHEPSLKAASSAFTDSLFGSGLSAQVLTTLRALLPKMVAEMSENLKAFKRSVEFVSKFTDKDVEDDNIADLVGLNLRSRIGSMDSTLSVLQKHNAKLSLKEDASFTEIAAALRHRIMQEAGQPSTHEFHIAEMINNGSHRVELTLATEWFLENKNVDRNLQLAEDELRGVEQIRDAVLSGKMRAELVKRIDQIRDIINGTRQAVSILADQQAMEMHIAKILHTAHTEAKHATGISEDDASMARFAHQAGAYR